MDSTSLKAVIVLLVLGGVYYYGYITGSQAALIDCERPVVDCPFFLDYNDVVRVALDADFNVKNDKNSLVMPRILPT